MIPSMGATRPRRSCRSIRPGTRSQAGVVVARTELQLVADRLTFPANGTAECRITVEPFVACTLHVQDVTGTVAVALTQALDPLILTADVAQPFTDLAGAVAGLLGQPLTCGGALRMPRIDKRIRVQQHLTRPEELLVLLMLDLVNPLREAGQFTARDAGTGLYPSGRTGPRATAASFDRGGRVTVAQLGSGEGSSYPHSIDTRQIFRNDVVAAPDSDTRIDAEEINDSLSAIVQIEESLGANVNGTYASLAARLGQRLGGAAFVSNLVSFAGRQSLPILGSQHLLNTRAIIAQVYDSNLPRDALQPGLLTVHPTTFDVLVTFAAAQSGVIVLGAPMPRYAATFGPTTNLTIPAATHGLAVPALVYALYDTATPAARIEPQSVTVHPTTREVLITFAVAQSGYVVLAEGTSRFTTTFTTVPSVTIPGPTHGLNSAGLLFQCYNSATPQAAFEPQTVTIHPETFDVTLTFATPSSGTVVLVAAGLPASNDFNITDGGVIDQTAVRLLSYSGALFLQAGSLDRIYLRNRLGVPIAIYDTANVRLGLGTDPGYQLHLATDSAAKPGSNLWTVASDARLKTVRGPFEDGLDLVLQLDPVWYRYNGQGGMPVSSQDLVAILAQHLQPLAPYMVGSYRGKLDPLGEEETDILTYEGHAMTFVLINAVKELHARVVALEEANTALRAQLAGPPPGEEPAS